MLQLILRAPSSIGNAQKAVQINRDTTIGGLKKYLESVLLIPQDKQVLRRIGSSRCILEQHNGLKCTDMGLTDDTVLEIGGPTLVTQNVFDIEDFKLQFSGNNETISLMSRCAILWKYGDCPEHKEDEQCHICAGTNRISVPMYCPFTPVINKAALQRDFLSTIDIQGNTNCKYDITKRRGNYELAVVPTELPDNKLVRVIANDCGTGISFITCKTRNENGEYIEPRKTQFRFIIESHRNAICRLCVGPIFHGENEYSPMVWAWACEGCHCILHPKCAIDNFQDAGAVQCGCIACVNGNANLDEQMREMTRLLRQTITPNPAFQLYENELAPYNGEGRDLRRQRLNMSPESQNGDYDGDEMQIDPVQEPLLQNEVNDNDPPPLVGESSSDSDEWAEAVTIDNLRMPGDHSSDDEIDYFG